jgi:hypothetical protein
MPSESVKKVQEILFRGGRSNSGPSSSRQSSAPESPALTIQIPGSVGPTSKNAQPKPHKKSTDNFRDQKKTETYRAALRAQLKDNYRGAERYRLEQDKNKEKHWKKWGPYVSDRQWVSSLNFLRSPKFEKANNECRQATVREDYSYNGDAWSHFPHEHARSRAYRWGEDGMAGISDNHQHLCFALSLWNGVDPILKERLFGLTGHQGNHGEDVKELYYYLDSTPTHSYMKFLYKYPQRRFPYEKLVEENARRSREDPEYEILDTDAFDEDRYWDVFVEVFKIPPIILQLLRSSLPVRQGEP